MNLEKTIRSLELRGYSVKHFAKGEEAADYLCEEVKDTSVGIGGCNFFCAEKGETEHVQAAYNCL